MKKELENYTCDGQTDIFDFIEEPKQPEPIEEPNENYKRKPLIYHMGLSAYYYQCPYCRAENSEKHSTEGTYCGVCGKYFDGVIERKTKDLIECEKVKTKQGIKNSTQLFIND